jgi:hypothetical protein
MEREDDPQLWDLLRHSKAPELSPFFARNVVRAVRNEPSPASTLASWFQLRRLIPSFSALAAIIIAAFSLHSVHNHHRSAAGRDAIAALTVSDSDLATDLDVLSGDDDSDDAPLL